MSTWVNRVVLTLAQLLPISPRERTSSRPFGLAPTAAEVRSETFPFIEKCLHSFKKLQPISLHNYRMGALS